MHAQRLDYFLKDTAPGLKACIAQVARIAECQRHLERLLPAPLAKWCVAGALEKGALVVFATGGAAATKIRQLTPTLVAGLQKRGVEVTSIRVEVQAAPRGKPVAARPAREIGENGMDALTRLEAELPDGPLRESVRRLLADAR